MQPVAAKAAGGEARPAWVPLSSPAGMRQGEIALCTGICRAFCVVTICAISFSML